VFFKESMLELEGVGNQLERNLDDDYRSDREMSLAMLKAQVDSSRRELRLALREANQHAKEAIDRALKKSFGPSDIDGVVRRTALETRMLEVRTGTARQRANQYEVEYHKKFAIPFACIVFVLLGAPLAVRFPRGGVGMVIAASLLIFGIYYVSLIGGESLGDRGTVPPFFGPWAPNVLFGSLALWGLIRIGTETATSRGGGWGEVWFYLRRVFTKPIRFRRRTA
jgi:lipopolysaccharide export system permease protein